MNFDLKDLKGLPPFAWGYAVILLFATFAPGILVIFLYKYSLFIELDLLKLIMLSFSITFPVLVVNTMSGYTFHFLFDDADAKLKYDPVDALFGTYISIFPLYLPILAKLLFDISTKMGLLIGLSFETGALIAIAIVIWVMCRKSKAQK